MYLSQGAHRLPLIHIMVTNTVTKLGDTPVCTLHCTMHTYIESKPHISQPHELVVIYLIVGTIKTILNTHART